MNSCIKQIVATMTTVRRMFVIFGICLMLELLTLAPACNRSPERGKTSAPVWSTSTTGCDLKKWPQLLPTAKRASNQQISVTFYETEKAPTASDNSVARPQLSDEQKCLLKGIQQNRSGVDTSMLKLQRYRTIISG